MMRLKSHGMPGMAGSKPVLVTDTGSICNCLYAGITIQYVQKLQTRVLMSHI